MSNIRLFYPESLSNNLSGKLTKDQSKYLNSVMRLKINNKFSLFNKGGEWNTKIMSINKGIVEFQVQNQLRQPNKEREIWLVFAPIKSNYFNFMLQKATEIGVTKLFPITTERTIVRKINEDRINKILIEASEQSNRLTIPSLEKIQKLEKFLDDNKNINLIFGDLNTDSKKIELKEPLKPIAVLIGPEGDFSENERAKILKFHDVQSIKLNDNILRSETAVISSLSIINYLIN
jgi:16S rRNA (uracil1498-N3)-methyltransferase